MVLSGGLVMSVHQFITVPLFIEIADAVFADAYVFRVCLTNVLYCI